MQWLNRAMLRLLIENTLDREEKIMAEWIEKTLGEVTSYITKGIPPKYVDDENPFSVWVLNQKCNRNFQISYDDARIHDGEKAKVQDCKLLQEGDVLINSTGTGTAGRVAQIYNVPVPTTIDGHMILIRPTDEIDFLYFGYAIKNNQRKIESLAEGSTGQTEINRRRLLDEVIIRFPQEKRVQKSIGTFIYNIDEKINNNIKINNNLEQQAEALFHSLFVKNANPTWNEGVLSDLGTVVAGGTPSKTKPEYYSEHGIAWITPKDLSLKKSKFVSHGEIDISELGFSKSSATKMPIGTVLFSSRAPIGYIAIAANEVTTNQGFKSVVPNENVGTAFMYYLLKFLLPTIERMASGSTFKEISGAGMKSVPVVIPDNETIEEFNAFCNPIFQQQEALEAENSRLTDIRDALLPKLMSGKLDVSAIDL